MMSHRALLVTNLLLLCSTIVACTSRSQHRVGQVRTPPDAAVRTDTPGNPGFRLPETMLDDKNTLTLTYLGTLHTYVGRFTAAHGRIPGQLVELRSISAEGFDLASVDGWGNAVQYEANGASYRLRSAGADSDFGTSDDLILASALGRSTPCFVVSGDGRRFDFGRDAPACAPR